MPKSFKVKKRLNSQKRPYNRMSRSPTSKAEKRLLPPNVKMRAIAPKESEKNNMEVPFKGSEECKLGTSTPSEGRIKVSHPQKMARKYQGLSIPTNGK